MRACVSVCVMQYSSVLLHLCVCARVRVHVFSEEERGDGLVRGMAREGRG